MTHYDPRSKDGLLPSVGGRASKGARDTPFQEEWIQACKGDLKTSCDFVYGGDLIEQMLLGLVSYRVGKKIEYDGTVGRIANAPEANQCLRRDYRKGWTLDG